MLVDGGGGDSGVAERSAELGVGLSERFHQDVDLSDQVGAVVLGLVSSAGGEVVDTAEAGPKFAQTGGNGFASPAEDLFGASRFSVAIVDGRFGLEPPASKAGQLAGGREDDIFDNRGQVAVHDRLLFREVATSWKLGAREGIPYSVVQR